VLLDLVASRTKGAFGVNFLIRSWIGLPRDRGRQGEGVEFFYGEPDATLVERVHGEGAVAGWQVGSLAEALAAEDAGCDFVVAQGVEAGGHVRGRVGS
jgi:hypothetical protein